MSNPRTAPRSSYITTIVKVASEYAETDEQKVIIEGNRGQVSASNIISIVMFDADT